MIHSRVDACCLPACVHCIVHSGILFCSVHYHTNYYITCSGTYILHFCCSALDGTITVDCSLGDSLIVP